MPAFGVKYTRRGLIAPVVTLAAVLAEVSHRKAVDDELKRRALPKPLIQDGGLPISSHWRGVSASGAVQPTGAGRQAFDQSVHDLGVRPPIQQSVQLLP